MLLEHLLALEQWERGKIRAIFPLFVGEAQDGTTGLSNFFATGGLPHAKRVLWWRRSTRRRASTYAGRRHASICAGGETRERVCRSCWSPTARPAAYSLNCRHREPLCRASRIARSTSSPRSSRRWYSTLLKEAVITEAQQLDGHGRAPPRGA